MSAPTPATQPAAISATIRRLRREKGLTQEALAQAVGVSPQAISKWETGQTMPDLTLLLPLSKVLGIGVNELLGGNRRQELMDGFLHATPFGEEIVLMACEKALEEFPDDEFFLHQRACALLRIGEKDSMYREKFSLMAVHEFYLLSSKNPDYYSGLAQAYLSLGDWEQAYSAMLKYTGNDKEKRMEPFLDEETRITQKQKAIEKCAQDLYFALRDYGTKESYAAAHTLMDVLMGDEKRLHQPSLGWYLTAREAILCRDAGDDEGFATHLTKAYEEARAVDALPREKIPYQSPLFDRLHGDRSVIKEHVTETFQFLYGYHEHLSHPAAVGLKKRILDEMFKCYALQSWQWREYLQFCEEHINFPHYFNYSIRWDLTEEEHLALEEEFMNSPYRGKYGGVVWQSIYHREAERLCQEGILKGYVAKHGSIIIAYCNCKEKSEYKRLPVPEKDCVDTAPEGSKILAIAELLISHNFRDCGLEEKLLSHVLANAKKQGYTHVEVYQMEDDAPELVEKWLDCYKRLGFSVVRDVSLKRSFPGEEDYTYERRYILQKEL